LFDNRLVAKIVQIVDIAYGGQNGFNQAIELSAPALANVKFIQEKKLIQQYFDEISQDTGKYCFGIKDTLHGLELGCVETLLCWEDLNVVRLTLRNNEEDTTSVVHLTPEQEGDESHFRGANGAELETVERISLVEWLCENYKNYGATLEFVTNKSAEGSQFCRGFGGIGGLLRYKVDFVEMNEYEDYEEGAEDDDWDDDCFI